VSEILGFSSAVVGAIFGSAVLGAKLLLPSASVDITRGVWPKIKASSSRRPSEACLLRALDVYDSLAAF